MLFPSEVTMKASRKFALRHLAFVVGLVALVGSAVAYVRVQHALQSSVRLEQVLAKNVGRIMTLDETLTMSARMASSAKDPNYEIRYNDHVGELDALIKETFGLVPDAEVEAAVASTDAANLRLVDMETRSFELNKAGRHAEALSLLESPEYKTDKGVYAAGMAKAFSRLTELTATSTADAEQSAGLLRVATLASLLLVIGAWAAEQRKQRKQAAEYAAQLEITVAQRTEQLAQRNRSMRLVFDTVQQGLISVDLDGCMAPERSAIVSTWLGATATRATLSAYVGSQDVEFANWFELGLAQLREGELPIEVCLGQMPKRLQLGARSIAVTYEPIITDGKCESLLVVMSDISVELERQRVEAEHRDLVQVLERVGRDRVGVINFLAEADAIVARACQVAEGSSEASSYSSLTRGVHTLKGITAQFGVSTVADVCHQLEDRLRDGVEPTARDRELLATTWSNLRERIRLFVGDQSANHLEVSRKDYEAALDMVRRRASHDELATTLLGWELDPVQARLERLGDYGQALAERLGKPAPHIVCEANGLRVNNANWAPLWAACVHLVRNAVDHGLEHAEQRSSAAKPVHGQLTLSAARDGQFIVVRFADDGRGVQWHRLAQKAADLGLSFETDAQQVEALFHDGLSGSETVTDVSGRGLGMAAVREQVTRRNGSVKVLSEVGRGTTVELRIPVTPSPVAYGRAAGTLLSASMIA
jgi:two-component system chemotaxis sensor kinase CheA